MLMRTGRGEKLPTERNVNFQFVYFSNYNILHNYNTRRVHNVDKKRQKYNDRRAHIQFCASCLRAYIIILYIHCSHQPAARACDNLYGRCLLMFFLPAVFTDKCWLGDANDSWRQEVVAKDEEAKTTLHARLGLGEYHCHSLVSVYLGRLESKNTRTKSSALFKFDVKSRCIMRIRRTLRASLFLA
jgi:hypothetical protein